MLVGVIILPSVSYIEYFSCCHSIFSKLLVVVFVIWVHMLLLFIIRTKWISLKGRIKWTINAVIWVPIRHQMINLLQTLFNHIIKTLSVTYYQVSNILNGRTLCWSGSWVKERLAKSSWQSVPTSAQTATRCWLLSKWVNTQFIVSLKGTFHSFNSM